LVMRFFGIFDVYSVNGVFIKCVLLFKIFIHVLKMLDINCNYAIIPV